MEMHQIKYFLAVADERHISRAADRCHVSQPSLSRAIKKLEDELGGELFERKPAGVELTPFGQHLRPFLQRSYEQAMAAKGEAAHFVGARRRELKVGIMGTVFHPQLACVMQNLSAHFGGLDMNMLQLPPDALLSQLLANQIEVAVMCRYALKDAQCLSVENLYRERYAVFFPAGHRFSAFRDINVEDLRDEPLLNTGLPPDISLRMSALLARPIANPRYTVSSFCLAQAMVNSGAGCALLPEFAPLRQGLDNRRLAGSEFSREVCLVSVAGRLISPAASTFMRILRSMDWHDPAERPKEAASA
jgi:DNA-binding transcriptional LysR family regulator